MGVNINLGKNQKLLEQCQTLKEYAIYVKKVRTYAKSMKVEEAVDRAVTECINEGILREFLLQNRKEAMEMSIFEYDEEAVFEVVRKDEYEKGIQEGEKQSGCGKKLYCNQHQAFKPSALFKCKK